MNIFLNIFDQNSVPKMCYLPKAGTTTGRRQWIERENKQRYIILSYACGSEEMLSKYIFIRFRTVGIYYSIYIVVVLVDENRCIVGLQ